MGKIFAYTEEGIQVPETCVYTEVLLGFRSLTSPLKFSYHGRLKLQLEKFIFDLYP